MIKGKIQFWSCKQIHTTALRKLGVTDYVICQLWLNWKKVQDIGSLSEVDEAAVLGDDVLAEASTRKDSIDEKEELDYDEDFDEETGRSPRSSKFASERVSFSYIYYGLCCSPFTCLFTCGAVTFTFIFKMSLSCLKSAVLV